MRPPPAVAVVGNSGSGKTRVVCGLVAALSQRGLRVGTIKHCPHGHESDRQGSDTDLHFRAGATVSLASSPGRVTRFELTDEDADLSSLLINLGASVDIVVAEGFKKSPAPKVIVMDDADVQPTASNVIATVGEARGLPDQPDFGFDDMQRLADHILHYIGTLDTASPPRVQLTVDGAVVFLGSFPSKALGEIVRGFASSLKGVKKAPRDITVTIQGNGPDSTKGHRQTHIPDVIRAPVKDAHIRKAGS